ncbi:aryl-sulfate sulfotransferase [Bizionia sediminis]|uniref:Aryl-sulfate sulfotransferase n=1 Tax=Bizionia sediminis TaxID=1737064 RepID=A0ABW5KU86_9FLAO
MISIGQNTVGAITNTTESFNALTLLAPLTSTETYLINNCGEVINQWSSNYVPSAAVYLLENGNLLRTAKIPNPNIAFGGVGGKIELFDWDNNLLWEYTYSTPTESLNHDIYPLPNGNILVLAVTTLNRQEAIQAGRNPALLSDNKLFNPQIRELEPVGTNQANIVWEWNLKDHLIQDFDSSKDNFGVVANNPQRLNINYLNNNNPEANWMHINSIQYNAQLQQIVFSSRRLSEIYIIDHSTTTEEAAGSTGGIYGRGGDFLYRWGNPAAYNKGTDADQKLFSQHFPHWIPDGFTDANKLIVFNNGNRRGFSSVDIINPVQTSPGVYAYNETIGYLPEIPDWIYQDPMPSNFFSAILSSGQRLPNGNTLICDGDSGYFFEINPNKEIVWEYINPDTSTGIVSQGNVPTASNNVFRATKYALNYPAFIGHDLTPGLPVELNPDLSNCTLLGTPHFVENKPAVYPNPTSGVVHIKSDNPIKNLQVYNAYGKLVATKTNSNRLNLESFASGLYIINITTKKGTFQQKIIKQ